MCGRFSLGLSISDVQALFPFTVRHPSSLASWQPRFNIAPGTDILTMVLNALYYRGGMVRWGWPAPWNPSRQIINAQVESFLEKPSFRDGRRALVVADSFYEWHQTGKYPYRIYSPSQRLLVMAALIKSAPVEPYSRVILLTQAADPEINQVHPRMPVILAPSVVHDWLAGGWQPSTRQTAPKIVLEAVRITQAINKPTHDGPDVQQPLVLPGTAH
ncbi:MAG: SOS response-associated peptidase [Firmicutes bacterium]|nr:SOS response-associated peptidase [Bacillota bacterium]